MPKLVHPSPKEQYIEELKLGGFHVQKKLEKYYIDTYLQNVYESQIKNIELKNGQIYAYRYDPKHKDILDYYDTQPLTLIYNNWYAKDGTYLYNGINLHFLPHEIKLQVLEYYWQYLYRFGGDKVIKIMPNVYYKFFKTIFNRLAKVNFQFALRTYIVPRIANPVLVPYNDWGKMILIKPNFILKKSVDEIYREYYNLKNL